jgi:hypothetical protein
LWEQIWGFALEHYIFHTVVVMTVIFLIFGGKISLRRLKRIGKDGLEFQDEKVDANAPCPFTESKKRSMEAISKNSERIAENAKAVEAVAAISKRMMAKLETALLDIEGLRMDQLKTIFWSTGQPPEERLIAGLKYVSRGGNHTTRAAVIKMAKERVEMYKVIVASQPELRLSKIGGGQRGLKQGEGL